MRPPRSPRRSFQAVQSFAERWVFVPNSTDCGLTHTAESTLAHTLCRCCWLDNTTALASRTLIHNTGSRCTGPNARTQECCAMLHTPCATTLWWYHCLLQLQPRHLDHDSRERADKSHHAGATARLITQLLNHAAAQQHTYLACLYSCRTYVYRRKRGAVLCTIGSWWRLSAATGAATLCWRRRRQARLALLFHCWQHAVALHPCIPSTCCGACS